MDNLTARNHVWGEARPQGSVPSGARDEDSNLCCSGSFLEDISLVTFRRVKCGFKIKAHRDSSENQKGLEYVCIKLHYFFFLGMCIEKYGFISVSRTSTM